MTEKELAKLLSQNPDLAVEGGIAPRPALPVPTVHLGQMTITIQGERVPSWNKAYAGQHWTKRIKAVESMRQRVQEALPPHTEPYTVPVDVSIVATYKGRVVDSDNVQSKLIIDALKGYVIRDDDPRYVRRVTTESRHGKANSITIQLTPVEK